MANSPTSTDWTAQPNGSPQGGAATTDIGADANALMDEAKSVAGKVADEAKEQVASLTDRAKAEVGEATDKVKSIATDQKDLLAEQVGGVADAIGKAASDLEQSNGPSAQYARMIADNAEKLSATIRDKDVDQLLGMAQDFGRRQPALFVGAAALLGFAASRFVLASAKRRDDQATPRTDYAGQGYGNSGYSSDSYSAGSAGNSSVTRTDMGDE